MNWWPDVFAEEVVKPVLATVWRPLIQQLLVRRLGPVAAQELLKRIR